MDRIKKIAWLKLRRVMREHYAIFYGTAQAKDLRCLRFSHRDDGSIVASIVIGQFWLVATA